MSSLPKFSPKDLAVDALLSAILFISQLGLSWLPNIELVSLFLILYTLVFEKHVWMILYVFVVMEGFIWGIGLWWFPYLYVWAILPACVKFLFKNRKPSAYLAATVSGIFGMLFGFFCSLTYILTGGLPAAFIWWTAGIPFDIVHGISNFILTLILFHPLYHVLTALKQS
ncbi:hypothetical protein [Clostridium sp. E02]|uniref:hypothetical protein n=1 Tax=Clostridium sp. E02 TaxID=2487134 RepID=UPI000F522AFA|nr:hypothetical protein [Clostridium sp. E02]